MKRVVIVQARTGSTRLPGKALMRVGGVTVLERVLARATLAGLGPVIVATTSHPADDRISRIAKRRGVACYRGSQHDVLDRYYRATAVAGYTDAVVRVTADCPLLCPVLLGNVSTLLAVAHADYAAVLAAPNGLDQEAFTRRALARSWGEARSTYDREHVVTFMLADPSFATVWHTDVGLAARSEWRLTVDEPDDLRLLRRLHRLTAGRVFLMDAAGIVELVESDPVCLGLATRKVAVA